MLSLIRRSRRPAALVLALVLCLTPFGAVADTYKIENGDITVEAGENGQSVNGVSDDTPVIITSDDPSTPSAHTVTITAEAGATANVTLQNLIIDTRVDPTNDYSDGAAAVATSGAGAVVIELEGSTTLTSGYPHAGLEKGNGGSLTIQDENNDGGSLTASGGYLGAGIGSGSQGGASGIIITGGTVVAMGGASGAGIGGGNHGDGSNIEITGGTVVAMGGASGAGIGGGQAGNGEHIKITAGTVTAVGGIWAAGIGGGYGGSGDHIEISGGTVIAVGGDTAPGIGGGAVSIEGEGGQGTDITVSGSAQVSAAGGAEDAWGFGTGAAIGNAGDQDGGKPVAGAEAEDTGELHTEGLYTTGSISYYPAGTTAEEIRNKEVAPVKVVRGTVEPPVEEEPEAREEDPFAAFTERLVWQIRTAPEKGVVEAGAGNWPGLQRAVFEALAKRTDVTLKITCRMNGEKTTLTIPGTADLMTPLGSGWMLSFEEIAKALG